MEPKQIFNEIKKLQLIEQIMLVEDIWDSIASSESKIPLPQWQKVELEKRYKEYLNGELKLHDWSSVHDELRRE